MKLLSLNTQKMKIKKIPLFVIILCFWLSNAVHSESVYQPVIGPPDSSVLMTLKQRLWSNAAKAEHLGEWEELLAITDQWQAMRPGDIELWVYRARAQAALQQYKDSEASYMRVLERYPNEDFIFLALAELAEAQGDTETACQRVATAVGIHPDYADALSFQERVCSTPEGLANDEEILNENKTDRSISVQRHSLSLHAQAHRFRGA